MTDYKCDPTKWTEMKGPIDGGRDTYQTKSWNPPKEKWGPFTKKGRRQGLVCGGERHQLDRVHDLQGQGPLSTRQN